MLWLEGTHSHAENPHRPGRWGPGGSLFQPLLVQWRQRDPDGKLLVQAGGRSEHKKGCVLQGERWGPHSRASTVSGGDLGSDFGLETRDAGGP